MSIYRVDDAGVEALLTASWHVSQACETVMQLTAALESAASDDPEALGPHAGSLADAIEAIRSAVGRAKEPAEEVSRALNSLAQKYREIIDDDPFANDPPDGSSGSASSAGGTGTLSGSGAASSFDELSAYLNTKYGIGLDETVKQLNLGMVKSAVAGVESVIAEYPDVGSLLTRCITSDSGVMSCSGDKLSFNPEYFSDRSTLENTCKEMSQSGFWVTNATPRSIGVHEAAHGVEWALIQANPQYKSDSKRVKAWEKCTEANKIVSKACKNIQSTPYGKGKNRTELTVPVSEYALKNASETMAEAFADVSANGTNANPFSKEIVRLTKELMSQYKGA